MSDPMIKKKRRWRLSNGLAKVAGARQEVLDRAPGGRGRQAAMGGVIVTTATLAAASATFALHMALNAPIWAAVIFGVGWGVVILNIDRMLVFGMGHERSWKRNVAMAAPRVVLAFILGVVISTPLTLQIFDREIQTQLLTQQQNRQRAYDNQLAGLTNQIDQAGAQIIKDQGVINGGAAANPSTDPRVTAAQQDVNSKLAYFNAQQDKYLQLANAAQCEFNGTCGTHVPGDGAQYRAAKALADAQQSVADAARQALTTANQQLAAAQAAATASAKTNVANATKDAQADLAATQKLRTQLTGQKAALEQVFANANTHDSGLLARLEALDELGNQHFTLRAAELLLAALFLCIEILPVLMKLLMNIGAETAYERIAKEMDEEDVTAYEKERTVRLAEQDAQVAAAKVRHTLIVSNAQDRVDRQRDVLKDINEAVTAQQKSVVLDALKIWAEHARDESARVLAEYEQRVRAATIAPHQVVVPPTTPPAPVFMPPPTQSGPVFVPQVSTPQPPPGGTTNGHAHPSNPVNGQPHDVTPPPPPDSPYVQGMDLPRPEDV